MTLDDLLWGIVPHEISRLCKEAGAFAAALPSDRPALTWYDPETRKSYVWDKSASTSSLPPGFGERPWIPIKSASGAFRPLFDAMQLTPNKFNDVFGGPTPLASMLSGGLLGAGLGYGGGWLAEKALGEKVLEPGRLRRLGALAGLGVGVLPGAYLGATRARLNAEEGKSPLKALVEPNVLFGKDASEIDAVFAKSANDAGALYMPTIPVDSFNRTIWADPNTPMPIRAAVAGLVDGASQLRGGIDLVSPADVGRIAIGMGSGLVSGMLVGRVLGALAGLTPEAQGVLKQTGMWSGALRNIVPRAFGF